MLTDLNELVDIFGGNEKDAMGGVTCICRTPKLRTAGAI